jgi:diguanylate cyclase (GGDEF)-like protein
VFDAVPIALLALNPDGEVVLANQAALSLLGADLDDLVNETWQHVLDHGRIAASPCSGDGCGTCEAVAEARGSVLRNVAARRYDDTDLLLEVVPSALVDQGERVGTVLALKAVNTVAVDGPCEDGCDALTGLPIRRAVVRRATAALEELGRGGAPLAILFVDLDGFKAVNDNLGHDAGDELLGSVAARLVSNLRPTDVVSRLGSDEFVVLCEGLGNKVDAERRARGVLDALAGPLDVAGQTVSVSACVGVAIADGPGPDAESLLRDAEAAMISAKKRGWSMVAVAETSAATAPRPAQRRLGAEQALRRALDEGELRVHFQPKVSLRTRRPMGAEALVRWQHPERGLVPPGEFVPIAEETGLVCPIGAWVLEEACRHAAAWRRARPGGHLLLSVNLSGRQLALPDLADTVAGVLERTWTAPTQLCLEVTETVLMEDVAGAVRALSALKEIGVQLAIDDFGTGHSSFSYLQQLPADILKIDKSFVDGLGQDAGSASIVTSLVNLARSLGMSTVAEGVERADQAAILHKLGCDLAQGYWFSRPLATDLAAKVLVEDRRLGEVAQVASGR